jgi:regulator of sigma E protease
VIPEKNTLPQNDNTFKEVGLIGIRPPMKRINLNLTESVISGSRNSVYTTYFIATRLGQLFMGFITGKIPLKEARNVLGGPVMIGQYAGESARTGDLWAFMAILSINLFILNLLPIPVLDGGHLLFLAIEVVRFGKPLTVKQRMWLIQVGLLIVLALMLLATANDLGRLFGF